MSYRSFKRVLGETSLERKCRFLFGACLLLLITGSFWWYGTKTESIVTSQNDTKGRLLVDTILALTHWEKFETNEQFKPVVRALSADLQSNKYDYSFIHPTALQTNDPPLEEFEREFLERARRTVPPSAQTVDQAKAEKTDEETRVVFDGRPVNDGRVYQYYEAVYATRSCIGCHRSYKGADNLAEGDLMAVAKVGISNDPVRTELNKNRALLLSTAIATVGLAMLASWVIVKYIIVKPLKHLRDISDAISRGDIDKRAELRTGDEFEELGVAFNRMLRSLVTVQDELRQVNSSLDVKLDELAQLNMQLFEMNRLKSDFLATMSHELRTPLNSIIGFSDVLGSISSLDDKQKRYVQNIQKSGKMLLDMINDILDLAKIESGKMEIRLIDFRIEQVIAAQCDMAKPLTEKKNIDLDIELESGLPDMYQDQSKVQQILNNLLSNAIKFTPEGGRIVVTAKRGPQEDLNIIIADTGVGIAEQDQVTIFEKFRQGNTVLPGGDAMTREYSGTGLGLSIVKELCKLLGGEITLQSELGRGSVFTVSLPWRIASAPKVETPLADDLDELTKPRRADFVTR